MTGRLIILGTSGLAREMAQLVEQVNNYEHQWEFAGFVGQPTSEINKTLSYGPILGDDNWLIAQNFEASLVIGIGYPKLRAEVLARYLEHGDRFKYPNIIHPSVSLDYQRVELGCGNIITAGCVFTCDIKVGNFNLFNYCSTVGHDCLIGNFNVFNPGVNVSGGVCIGDHVLAGTGCQILQNMCVNNDAVIGAGAVVRNEVSAGQTVVGVPAKPLEKHNR